MIYLDHHATSPMSAHVRAALRRFIDSPHYNASSIHRAGRQTRALVEDARATLATQCGAMSKELVFTSGGTESLHLCMHSALETSAARSILVDPGAHPALLAAATRAAKHHGASVHRLRADRSGRADAAALEEALAREPTPSIVALTCVQHETGTITPLRALVDIARRAGASVVLDAIQALGKIPVDFGSTGAVAAALSAHKIAGPTGVGAAWIRHDQRARALIDGGGQERGARAGTENVLGIVGFGAAAEALATRLAAMSSTAARRDEFEGKVRQFPGFSQTVRDVERVATAAHFLVDGVAGEEIVAALDLDGVCVSAGPACSSGRSGVSESLVAMFGESVRSKGALRVTLSPDTTAEELRECAERLAVIAQRMQEFR